MPSLTFPIINGNRYDHSSVELDCDGRKYNGFKSIDYDHELVPGEGRGNRAQVVARSRGKYAANGSIEFYKDEYYQLIEQLGDGYMEREFSITVAYSEANSITKVDRLYGCRLKKASHSSSEGGEVLTVKCELHVMRISENGKDPVSKFRQQFLK